MKKAISIILIIIVVAILTKQLIIANIQVTDVTDSQVTLKVGYFNYIYETGKIE